MFPPDLKLTDGTPFDNKKSKNSEDNYRPMSTYPTYLKFMKDAFMIKFRLSSILFCPNISAGFKEAIMHSTV